MEKKEFLKKLDDYARAIVKIGINLQKDQVLAIRTDIMHSEFVHVLTKRAYLEGAKEVVVIYNDEILDRYKYKYASLETVTEVKESFRLLHDELVEKNAAFVSVVGSNPNNLEGLDVEKIKEGSKTRSETLKGLYNAIMSDKNSWCVVGAASYPWAKMVFPELSEEEAVEKLWELIFYTARITEDPIKEWENHIENLLDKAKFLNQQEFKYLHYKNDLGTDLKIELPKGHIWHAARSINSKGKEFTANMPTEEVYTLPHKDGINGIVYSSKALNYNGNLIDEFFIEFKDGRAINCGAKKGEEVLKTMLKVDEGAKSLGEVALVPYNSPISNSNVMFFETLYDENASCHLALGRAYPTCLKGYENLSEEELLEKGANFSLIHVDFMIGDSSLNIEGIKEDGTKLKVFEKGNWAF